MTQVAKRHSTGSTPDYLTALIARFQRDLSDRVHASSDALAREDGWAITATIGRLGFGARSYRDPRFTCRPAAARRNELTPGPALGRLR